LISYWKKAIELTWGLWTLRFHKN